MFRRAEPGDVAELGGEGGAFTMMRDQTRYHPDRWIEAVAAGRSVMTQTL